jgi:Fe-S cluster assembly ATP-binding protein
VTHYHKLLEYVQPDFVHVLKNGAIVKTGGRELIGAIESEGFDQF